MSRTKSDPRFYALANAAWSDLKEAARLVEADPAILEARNSIGETALHYLAVEEAEEAVRWLLKRGASVNTRNSFGATPLMETGRLASLAMVRLLLEKGADPRLTDHEGDTALSHAASGTDQGPEREAVLRLLLDQLGPGESLGAFFPDVTAHMVMTTSGPVTDLLRECGLVDPWEE